MDYFVCKVLFCFFDLAAKFCRSVNLINFFKYLLKKNLGNYILKILHKSRSTPYTHMMIFDYFILCILCLVCSSVGYPKARDFQNVKKLSVVLSAIPTTKSNQIEILYFHYFSRKKKICHRSD